MGTLYILGSGTPTPTESRFGTSYILELDEDFLMFDCGPASTHKLVKMGLLPTRINYLFFTHHHFDHNSDYPCFLLSRWDQSIGKEKQLKIFGPVPTKKITERLVGPDGAFSYDWKARVGHRLSMSVFENRGGLLPRPPPSLDVKDISPKMVIKGEKWSVKTASVVHVQPFLESLAYRVDSNEGSIVFAGDTEPCQSVVDLAIGADSLVVNCWDHQGVMDANGEALGQTGTLGAATMARDSGVKKLILTHTGSQLSSPGSKEKGIEDIRSIFKGEVIFCEELMKICL
jgi:ribonuclease BN (tRNA processing enzyme)